jgi:DNA-binding MarR family transcriptional regulator
MSSGKRADLIESLVKEVRKFIAGVILFNEKVAASLGLNGTDLQILHLLELGEAVTPGHLARWSGLTTGGVTVVLDRLESAGYIKRQPNPADRRSTLIRTVPVQMRKLQSIYRSKGQLLLDAVSGASDSELRVILDFFHRTNTGKPEGI